MIYLFMSSFALGPYSVTNLRKVGKRLMKASLKFLLFGTHGATLLHFFLDFSCKNISIWHLVLGFSRHHYLNRKILDEKFCLFNKWFKTWIPVTSKKKRVREELFSQAQQWAIRISIGQIPKVCTWHVTCFKLKRS